MHGKAGRRDDTDRPETEPITRLQPTAGPLRGDDLRQARRSAFQAAQIAATAERERARARARGRG